MSAWLRCTTEPGMLPGEYAVEIDTSENGRVSLFAPEDKVRAADKLIRIEVLEENGAGVLVCLPSPAFEISSRTVKVPRNALVQA